MIPISVFDFFQYCSFMLQGFIKWWVSPKVELLHRAGASHEALKHETPILKKITILHLSIFESILNNFFVPHRLFYTFCGKPQTNKSLIYANISKKLELIFFKYSNYLVARCYVRNDFVQNIPLYYNIVKNNKDMTFMPNKFTSIEVHIIIWSQRKI